MTFQQTVEQWFVSTPPHLPKLERANLAQACTQLRGINGINDSRLWSGSLDQRIGGNEFHRRQLDLSCSMQHQQQTPTDHVARRSVGLLPLPGLAQLFR